MIHKENWLVHLLFTAVRKMKLVLYGNHIPIQKDAIIRDRHQIIREMSIAVFLRAFRIPKWLITEVF